MDEPRFPGLKPLHREESLVPLKLEHFLIGAGPSLYWIKGPWNGHLAISARPRGGDWLHDEMQAIRAKGVDVLVSLLEEEEDHGLGLSGSAAAIDEAGGRLIAFPIADRSVPVNDRSVRELLGELQRELNSGHTVAIHCRQSVGRAGMIAAALLILGGMDVTEAVRRVSSARGVTIPETREQSEWLNAFALAHSAMR